MKTPLASLSPEALDREVFALGAKRFVADQILKAVYERNVRSFDAITNLSLDLRRQLAERFELRTLKVAEHRAAPDGSFKLVLELADRNLIECAYLASDDGRGTACISSQVGCAMGCVFCASGSKGWERNLDVAEMVEQVLLVRDALTPPPQSVAPESGARQLTGVTVMGVGEPLANLENVLAALETVNSPRALGIGARKIAISTCGLPEGIRRLAAAERQYHLAVSLHAPNDDVRRRIMPMAGRVATIDAVLKACREYFERTHRKVTFEYALIQGVNDDEHQAAELAKVLGGLPCLVNLIPLNPTENCPDFKPSTKTRASRFLAVLERAGLEACLRRRRGAEVDAACGQLRAQRLGRADDSQGSP
jgi:23S rRNA (adenine2503-C2)-methyltransferase